MEELLEGLRELWNGQKFEEFLKKVRKLLKDLKRSTNDKEMEASKATVEFALHSLPELSKNKNRQIHKYIQEIYSLCEKFESTRTLAESCNEYVRNVICTEIMQYTTFAGIHRCLEISERVFKALEIEKEKLKWEDEVCKVHAERNEGDGYKCSSQKMAVELLKKWPIFPITICKSYKADANFPGVYLIYYVGETLLYGDLVSHSQVQPIYVGESCNNIFQRLRVHCQRLEEAKDLKETDFIVRFIIVDIQYFATATEKALIDFYRPLWNFSIVQLNFGNAQNSTNK